MGLYIIKNASVINENKIIVSDILIENDYITKIDVNIPIPKNAIVINAEGLYAMPGVIDDQVHFREPGLTHKATIETESKAAVAGGITSFIEQPNTVPNATTQELLEQKYQIAAQTSFANYSFMMGGTNDNLDELLKTDVKNVAGIKLFLGSSTGNMLVDNPETLEKIFSNVKTLIAVHCEDEATIKNNLAHYKFIYGEDIPVTCHSAIRSAEACYISSSKAVALAKKTGARLHIFHISTAKELELFTNTVPVEEKQITAEVCIHHLWFTDQDYINKGNFIKWNPAVKTEQDREALWQALLSDKIDVIATDHAPHTKEEKQDKYLQAPSGGPLVQHALVAMLEHYKKNKISLEKIVEKMSHNPAKIFKIEKRGFIKEGYFADIVLFNLNSPWQVKQENILYKCGWSPFENELFQCKITHTFVNGNLVYNQGVFNEVKAGKRLTFNR
ncbi:dihydroorotase [Flavobacterium croceum]|uniref:dihydroorotase n=1 Tax=Flavobacterium croceum TaxID=370975 RepID=UPI0024A92BAF|nr:dihydroorotase [Flavobacterium croceum]